MKTAFAFITFLSLSACTSYPIANDVKMVSFDDNPTKGQSVGPIRGEDCIWSILGYQIGGQPTLDRAMANARTQSGGGLADQFRNGKKDESNSIRYINNVSTGRDGFNAVVVGKNCLVVKGNGYR